MKAWNHQDALERLQLCLSREMGMGKTAEDVSTIKDMEAAQDNLGAEQQAEIENAPAMAPVDGSTNGDMAEPMSDVNHTNGTDGSTNAAEVGMKVKNAPESVSKQASIGQAFARGLHSKYASVMKQVEENRPYMTGTEMFQKKAAMMNADADTIEKAASEFYAGLEELHKNPCFRTVFEKCAARKMAEDVAAAMELAGVGPEAEAQIAADLEQAVAEDPELAAELEGEITNDAIDELAMAEEQAAIIDQIAAEAGTTPEAVVEAATLIEEAAAENNMPVEEFVQVLDAAMQEEAAAAEAAATEVPATDAPVAEAPVTETPAAEAPAAEEPVVEEVTAEKGPEAQVKEASMRRIAKAAAVSCARQ